MNGQSQLSFLSEPEKTKKIDSKYNLSVKAPIYEPKNKKPIIQEIYDTRKTDELIKEIESSGVNTEEKKFLIKAAQRHTVFNYQAVADYYASSSEEVQRLMENSALVIIDFDRAIERGFVKLADDIADQYREDNCNG